MIYNYENQNLEIVPWSIEPEKKEENKAANNIEVNSEEASSSPPAKRYYYEQSDSNKCFIWIKDKSEEPISDANEY